MTEIVKKTVLENMEEWSKNDKIDIVEKVTKI